MTNFITDFSSDFDEILGGWFGKPQHLVFNCKNKDMNPVYWEKTDNGYKATCRTVGIRPEDVKVVLENNYIHIEGSTDFDGYNYSTSFNLPIVEDVRDNIKDIKYKVQDGITIIYLNVNKQLKQIVDIKRID